MHKTSTPLPLLRPPRTSDPWSSGEVMPTVSGNAPLTRPIVSVAKRVIMSTLVSISRQEYNRAELPQLCHTRAFVHLRHGALFFMRSPEIEIPRCIRSTATPAECATFRPPGMSHDSPGRWVWRGNTRVTTIVAAGNCPCETA